MARDLPSTYSAELWAQVVGGPDSCLCTGDRGFENFRNPEVSYEQVVISSEK